MRKDVAIAIWHEGPSPSQVRQEMSLRPWESQPHLFLVGSALLAGAILWEVLGSTSHFRDNLPLVILWFLTISNLSFSSRRASLAEIEQLDDPDAPNQELVKVLIQSNAKVIGDDRGMAEVSDGMFSFVGHRTSFCFGNNELSNDGWRDSVRYKSRNDTIVVDVDGPEGVTRLTLTKLKRFNRRHRPFGKDIYRPEPSFGRALFDLPRYKGQPTEQIVLPPTSEPLATPSRTAEFSILPANFLPNLAARNAGLNWERRLVLAATTFFSAGTVVGWIASHNLDKASSVGILAVLLLFHLCRFRKWPSKWLNSPPNSPRKREQAANLPKSRFHPWTPELYQSLPPGAKSRPSPTNRRSHSW